MNYTFLFGIMCNSGRDFAFLATQKSTLLYTVVLSLEHSSLVVATLVLNVPFVISFAHVLFHCFVFCFANCLIV